MYRSDRTTLKIRKAHFISAIIIFLSILLVVPVMELDGQAQAKEKVYQINKPPNLKVKMHISSAYQATNGTSGAKKYVEVELLGKGFGREEGIKRLKIGSHYAQVGTGGWSDTLVVKNIEVTKIQYGKKYSVYFFIRTRQGKELAISNKVSVTFYMLIHQVKPDNGWPNTLIEIGGGNSVVDGFFGARQGKQKVKIGNQFLKVKSWSDTKITGWVPPLTRGIYDLYITNGLLRVSKKKKFTVNFKKVVRLPLKKLK